MEASLRSLRVLSRAVTIFAGVILLAGLVQIALAGIAVNQEYGRIAQREADARQQAAEYGYRLMQDSLQMEYDRTSTAFFLEGRFLPSDETLQPDAPAVVSLIVLTCSILAFGFASMAWVWRAHANLRDAGLATKQGPTLAVAAYFIPFANFMLPFEGMRELFNRSRGEGEDFANTGVDEVTAWWTAVIASMLIFSAITVKFLLDLGTNVIIMTPLWMEFGLVAFTLLLLFGSAYLFAGLTRAITSAQEEYLPQVDPEALRQEQAPRPRVTLIDDRDRAAY